MKSYTEIEQSKNLVKILPLESADMCYRYYSGGMITGYGDCVLAKSFITGKNVIREIDLPCWSLSALLGVLPKTIDHETLFIETSPALWHIGYRNVYTARTDNPIDTCYELILKLNELNLL